MTPPPARRPFDRFNQGTERDELSSVVALLDMPAFVHRRYTRVTRLIVAGGLSSLTVLIALLVVVANLSGVQAALAAGVFISGLATLVGLAGTLSLWTVRRKDDGRQGEREEQLLKAIMSKSALIEIHRSNIAEALEALGNPDTTTQISALAELKYFSTTSAENALVVVPAIESFIRTRVPSATSGATAPENGAGDGRPNVQVALELLGSLPERIRFNARRPIRFRLEGLDLREYNFQNLDFSAASFRGSDLTGCILSRGIFDGADLRGANFARCVANEASFKRAVVEEATFRDAFLPDVNFTGALLYRVNMSGATLYRADFSLTVLFDCDLKNADLREADLDSVKAHSNRLAEGQLSTYGMLRLVDPLESHTA